MLAASSKIVKSFWSSSFTHVNSAIEIFTCIFILYLCLSHISVYVCLHVCVCVSVSRSTCLCLHVCLCVSVMTKKEKAVDRVKEQLDKLLVQQTDKVRWSVSPLVGTELCLSNTVKKCRALSETPISELTCHFHMPPDTNEHIPP